MRIIRTEYVRMPSSADAWIEVAYEAPEGPGRWRRAIAAWLIRIAGRLAGLRVRVVR